MSIFINTREAEVAWYLIHSQARREVFAANVLRDFRGLNVFLPEYAMRSHGEMRRIPFFPGYFFIQADLQKVPLSQINSSPGVLRLVDFGGTPQSIPDHVVEEIANRLSQPDIFLLHPFQPGDIVRFKQPSPLQDLEMVFVGPITPSQRVHVLLNFLGRLKEVQVDVDLLEKVSHSDSSQPPHSAHERYTRGKGRKIEKGYESV